MLKIAVTESLEEGAQSLADDLIHNEIVDAADGRAADGAISPGDMAVRALVRTAEAFPAGVGFGLAAPLGSAGAALRHARRLSSAQAREEAQVQHTLTGTVMLDGLQQVSSSAKLKQTAPDVQEKVIRAQVQGSPFEAAYVDTVAALQSPEGAKDLEAVARAAGISDEELSLTIAREGLLYVPVEKYAQSAASPALLEAVSFSPEADSIARMKMNARALTDAMEKAQKDAIKARTQAVHAIVNAWFPEAPVHADEKEKLRRDADREMAVAAITQDPDSPAHGWRVLYDAFTAERDALLHPALDALARGMKKGVDILQNGADGRGIRVSNNAPWYQEYYKENGKAPNQEQLRDLAYLLTVGDVSAPKVEGWMPSSQEAADAMEAARGQLDELNAHIGTLSNIKDRMMQLDAAEVRATQGLTPEAYAVYHAVMAKLREIGGVQAQAARLNALLFAARADAVARVMREKGGRPDYTARDYFDGFVLRYGGKYVPGGFEQRSSSRRLKEDMLAWKQKVDDFFAGKLPLRNNVMMRSPLVFDLIGADSSIPLAIDSKILQKLVDKHHFTRKELLRLPEKLADPLFVLRALGNNGVEDKQKRIVVIDMQINGATVMVPFVMNTGQGFNKIASAYGREKASGVPNDQWYMNRLDQANLLYINKKRTDRWVAARTGAAGSHNAPLAIQSLNNISVPNETDLGKLKKARPGFYQEMHDAMSSQMAAVRKRYEGTPQWMMAPNGKPTNLTEEEWLAVRTPAFKAAFGDWEARARLILPHDVENLEEAAATARSVVGKCLTNDVLGVTAVLSNKNISKMVSASATRKSVNARVHVLAVANVDHLFRHAVAEYTHKDRNDDKNIRQIHRMFAPFVVGNDVFVAKLTVKELAQEKEGNRLYSVEALEIKEASRNWNAAYNAMDGVLTSFPQEAFEDIIASFLHDGNDHDLTHVEAVEKDADFSANPVAKTGGEKPTPSVNHSITQWWKGVNEITLAGDVDENGEPLPSVLSSRHNQEQQRAIYGAFSKENGKKIITLFAGANPSTMLHEMGHMFLDDLDELAQFDEASAKDLATVNEWAAWHEGAAKEYENTPWAEEFRAHEAAIRDALKSGDAIALRAARNRWRHERFARGFELYLYEGKAPSKALRGVFRRFKQLLRRIYQFVKDVGGKPSPEVEAVMARMIASEEAIKAAELDERWRPVEKMGGKEALDDLLGDDVADTYAKWLEEAREDAEDILRARVMKDLRKEARKEFKARVEAERERKRVQLENEPVYLAEAAIRAQMAAMRLWMRSRGRWRRSAETQRWRLWAGGCGLFLKIRPTKTMIRRYNLV